MLKEAQVPSNAPSPEITERGQVEEKLEESAASYKELADSITDVFFAMDKDLKYTYWNKASEKLRGIPAKDAIGKSLYELFPEVKGTKPEKMYLDVLKTQQPRSFVTEYQLGGKDFFFEISAYPSKQGIAVFTKDITERKRMERVLNERVKELQCLYGIAYIVERPGIAIDELCQEVVNLLPASWQYPEITCARVTLGEKAFKTDNFRTTEWKQSASINVKGRKEGIVEVYYLEARPELDEGPFSKDERLLIDVIAQRLGRITERKRAEEEMKVKDSAIASSINAVAIADLEGNVTYVNPAFLRMWGYDSEKEVLGKSAVEFWQVAEEAVKVMQATMDRGGWIGELAARRKDGSKFDTQLSVSVVRDEAGKPICRFGSFVDITERKRMEEALRSFNELAVGRELRMIELKKEINIILQKLGEEPRYKIVEENNNEAK